MAERHEGDLLRKLDAYRPPFDQPGLPDSWVEWLKWLGVWVGVMVAALVALRAWGGLAPWTQETVGHVLLAAFVGGLCLLAGAGSVACWWEWRRSRGWWGRVACVVWALLAAGWCFGCGWSVVGRP